MINNLFQLQALCDLIVEAVFPTCAICLLEDKIVCDNAVVQSALKSGEIYRETSDEGGIIAGSLAEGLTMENGWGHPWSDADGMVLIGAELGVNIPGDQLPRECQSTLSSSPALTSQGCRGNSCLDYAPEGSPPAYTKLRVTDIQGLMKWNIDEETVDLSDCVEERDGHSWLNTARLNQATMRKFNEGEDNPAERITGFSGPAAQVI